MTTQGFLTFVAGEVLPVKFTITYKATGALVDLTGCTYTLVVSKAGTALFTKTDSDFDTTQEATGVIKVTCSWTTEGIYDGRLTVVFGGGTTKKHLFGIKIKGIN